MRIRNGILAVALAATLSACTDDSDKSPKDGPLTEIAIDCDRFADTAKKINDAQTALYTGTGGEAALDTLETELEALKDGAPADVKRALTDMSAAFRDAQEVLENPTPENKAKLADLSEKLSSDGQRITAYITSECD